MIDRRRFLGTTVVGAAGPEGPAGPEAPAGPAGPGGPAVPACGGGGLVGEGGGTTGGGGAGGGGVVVAPNATSNATLRAAPAAPLELLPLWGVAARTCGPMFKGKDA